MKTSHILNLLATAFAAVAFTLQSCTKSEEDETVSPESNVESVIFGAGRSDGAPDTKTGLYASDETKVSWKSGDQIGVWSDGSIGSIVTFNMLGDLDGETTETRFKGDITTGDKYYAIYGTSQDVTLSVDSEGNAVFSNVEVKTDQNAVAGDFDAEAAPMVAFTTDAERYLRFKNVFSLIKFSTSDFTFTKAKFTSNNTHDPLTGKADVSLTVDADANDSEAAVTAHSSYDDYHSYVTIGDGTTKLGGDASKYYYFAVLPGTLSEGFTISFDGVEAVTSSAKANPTSLSSAADFHDAPAVSTSSTVVTTQSDGLTFPYETDVETLKANGWTLNGHEFVDLGITNNEGQTVYFATMNVGAEKVGDFGDYYAWGAMSPYYTTDWVTVGATKDGVTAKRESNFYHSSSGKCPQLSYEIPTDLWIYKKTTTGTESQRFRKSSKERVIERDNIYTLGTFTSSNVKSYTTPYGYKWDTYIMLGLAKANSKDLGDGISGTVTEADPCIYANSTGSDNNLMILNDSHDIARTWGASWRMPRNSGELAKLENIIITLRNSVENNSDSDGDNVYTQTGTVNGKSYTLEWIPGENTEYNGHCGFRLTYNGGTEGHSTIFLPSTGWYIGTDATNDSGYGKDLSNGHFTQIRYWSSTRAGADNNGDGSFAAMAMNMRRHNASGDGMIRTNRAHGHTVRPIFVAGVPAE